MREPIRDSGRLRHILQSIDYVLEFTQGLKFEDFTTNKVLYFAVIKNIEIIGEASYMLTNEFKDAHPATDWKTITGMRHYIVHGYYQINDHIVWDVATNDLLPLKNQILDYLKEFE
jgi:uncharacterized protein with HEPN domain